MQLGGLSRTIRTDLRIQSKKTDTALIGLAAQFFDTSQANSVVFFTTDKPAGRAAESLLPSHGFTNDVVYRYASVEFLETMTAAELND